MDKDMQKQKYDIMQEKNSDVRNNSEKRVYIIKDEIQEIKMKIEQSDLSQELEYRLAELQKQLRVANELAYGRD